MNLAALLFSLSGRIGRRAFWLGMLCLLAAGIAVATARHAGLTVVAAPLAVGALYVLACLNAKRLNAIGQSPWLQLLPWILAFIPALAELLLWCGRQVLGLGAVAGPLILSVDAKMLVWFVLVFEVWLGLSRGKITAEPPLSSEPNQGS